MRWILGIAAFITIIFILNMKETREPVVSKLSNVNTAVGAVIAAPAVDALGKINEHALQQVAEARKREYDAQKVKVYVEGRDTKTCMNIYKTSYINNKVIECNKDRTVEMRRDEVQQFKLAEGIDHE